MENPIMPASGCFGYGEEMAQFFDLSLLGAVVTKGTTLEPREGNDPPRMIETRAGIINFIGLQNPGIEVVIREKMPFLRKFDVPVVANIAGRTIDDYVNVVRIIERAADWCKPDAIEVNISCPNVKKGGMAFGQDPDVAAELVACVRKTTSISLIVKLTPNVTDIVAVARAVVQAGANALSLINTLKSRAKIWRGPSADKWVVGGLSGPAIRPIAVQKVFEVAEAKLGVPIIGMGGIQFLEDALEFFEAGADAIAIGTANFVNPMVMPELIKALEGYMVKENFATIQDLKRGKKQSPTAAASKKGEKGEKR